MGFSCGIVGLPNVGKSTLFNALTETAAAEAANYPFCTIEPNAGVVGVPDPRLDALAGLAQSQKIIPTQLGFTDIAGLVRGAAKGEGLGNQFLGHIREVDAVAHVLRCFEDDDITHVDGTMDPLRDKETIETELMLADLESLEKRQVNLTKKARGGDKEAKALLELIAPLAKGLADGTPARALTGDFDADARDLFRQLQLLTGKPVLYVCNVEEAAAAAGNAASAKVAQAAAAEGAAAVTVSAAIEAEVAQLPDPEEKAAFLEDMGLSETGLARVIRAGYGLLNLLTFFTVGPKEARAWTAPVGATAPNCAGVIHTDFERGFIAAETIAYEDFIACAGEAGAKEAGKMRLEGREYKAKDGDVFHFRFNV